MPLGSDRRDLPLSLKERWRPAAAEFGGGNSRASGSDDADFYPFKHGRDYLSLSDASAINDRTMATIQKRIVTLDSGQPISSK